MSTDLHAALAALDLDDCRRLTAQALLVQTWAVGYDAGRDAGHGLGLAEGREQALGDVEAAAVTAGTVSGLELTAAEALERLGAQLGAQRARQAVEDGRAAFLRAARAVVETLPYSELARRRGEPEQLRRALAHEERIWAGWPGRGAA